MRHEKVVSIVALCAVLALGAILFPPAAEAIPSYCTSCYPAAADMKCTCPPGTRLHPLIVTCQEYWYGGCRYFTDQSVEVPLDDAEGQAVPQSCVEPAPVKAPEQAELEIAAD